ncbi:hypothetical protein V2J09_019646 [Rumex salicifolius]
MTRRLERTIYVGNLPGDTREREVEDLFYKYGRIVEIDLKIPPRPPGYAFVEFEDEQDADDAVRGRDGYDFDGHRLRVEFAHGGRSFSSSDRYSIYSGSSHRGGLPRHSDYRVKITGLPSSASWQDLKDHMRRAGDVCFSQVFRDRGRGMTGIVDYTNYDDMRRAVSSHNLDVLAVSYSNTLALHLSGGGDRIRKLDDSEFRNAFSRGYYIRVREYDSRSPSPYRRSRSRSYSPARSYSRSRSYSISPRAKRSGRSISRSVSKSPSSHNLIERTVDDSSLQYFSCALSCKILVLTINCLEAGLPVFLCSLDLAYCCGQGIGHRTVYDVALRMPTPTFMVVEVDLLLRSLPEENYKHLERGFLEWFISCSMPPRAIFVKGEVPFNFQISCAFGSKHRRPARSESRSPVHSLVRSDRSRSVDSRDKYSE